MIFILIVSALNSIRCFDTVGWVVEKEWNIECKNSGHFTLGFVCVNAVFVNVDYE